MDNLFWSKGKQLGNPLSGEKDKSASLILSPLHIAATLLLFPLYVNKKDGSNYSHKDVGNVDPIAFKVMETMSDSFQKYIQECRESGFLKLIVTDTIEGKGSLKEWLKENNPGLNITIPEPGPRGFFIAAYSSLPDIPWTRLFPRFTTFERRKYGREVLEIQGGTVFEDKFGNKIGIFKMLDKAGKAITVRITKIDPVQQIPILDIVNEHEKEDSKWTKLAEYKGFAFVPFEIDLGPDVISPIRGATVGTYELEDFGASGKLQITKEGLNYSLLTVAVVRYRGGGCSKNIQDGIAELFDEDGCNNLVELFYEKHRIIFATTTEEDYSKQ